MINYNSAAEVARVLRSRGIVPKKRWGQNFLVSAGVREKLIKLIGPGKEDVVWEIGAGLGALTSMLTGKGRKFFIFEIDPVLIDFLKETFGSVNRLYIIEGDFLKRWQEVREKEGVPDIICGNLPYSSGSAIIVSLIKKNCIPDKMVFTLQREMARRLIAEPGSKSYSSFSFICQFVYKVKHHGDVRSGSFYPVPDVFSSIIEMVPHNRFTQLKEREIFFSLVDDLFASRRKTIRNNIFSGKVARNYGINTLKKALSQSPLNLERRGESLSVDEVVVLAQRIGEVNSGG